MPTTRSKSKVQLEEKRRSFSAVEESDSNAGYYTRTKARSQSEPTAYQSPQVFKFPFFDDKDANISRDYEFHASRLSEQKKQNSSDNSQDPFLESSEWDAVSPIAKGRDSDASERILDVSSEDLSEENDSTDIQNKGVSSDNEYVRNSSPMEAISPSKASEDDHSKSPIPDFSDARKQLGQSSNEFIERIRSAAHRRKLAMARSRDSLVAKEEKQLQAIAEAKAKAAELANMLENRDWKKNRKTSEPSTLSRNVFKARPLPATTGVLGSGGLDGVPKIDKRPTTTPFSPLLGHRRRERITVQSLVAPAPSSTVGSVKSMQNSKQSKKEDQLIRPFKARPVPPAISARGSGGQHGIPKVSKRPPTIAKSPLLGSRRRQRSCDPGLVQQTLFSLPKSKSEPALTRMGPNLTTSSPVMKSPMTVQSPLLHGLKLLDTTRLSQTSSNGKENSNRSNLRTSPYIPHSTIRAKKRASYDVRKASAMQIKAAEERRRQEQEIKQLRRELQTLRHAL